MKSFSLDDQTRMLLLKVGNQAQYLEAIVKARDRAWRKALKGLINTGVPPKAIIEACRKAKGEIHTAEDMAALSKLPTADMSSPHTWLYRSRMAVLISEWRCGNRRLQRELYDWESDT